MKKQKGAKSQKETKNKIPTKEAENKTSHPTPQETSTNKKIDIPPVMTVIEDMWSQRQKDEKRLETFLGGKFENSDDESESDEEMPKLS